MTDPLKLPPPLELTPDQKQEAMRLAAVGMAPREIAVSMELEPAEAVAFCIAANDPSSEVGRLMITGALTGKAVPQVKLQEQAAAGNIDAIKLLQTIQARNRYNELLANIDDDELTS